MTKFFFLFLGILLVLAVFLRADFVVTLLYLFLGAFVLGRWWGKRSLFGVEVHRTFVPRAFLGEEIPIQLEIKNSSYLPLPWLQLRESLPVELSHKGAFQQVTTIGPKSNLDLTYSLQCKRRGFYPVGPLVMYSSDVFGMVETQKRREEPDYLTIFPKIVPLSRITFPSHAPMGTLRHTQPIFEDPTRVLGKRDYVSGDSMRRVDWKSSASTGRLQVKMFEPSIALETAIFLNLNGADYTGRSRYDIAELAIVVAASIANWIVSARQSVGLLTNGVDPLLEDRVPPALPPRRGRNHLLRILETLARIRVADTFSLDKLLNSECNKLSWGTTLIAITNKIYDDLFDSLFQARRSGLNVHFIQCGPADNYQEIRRRAALFGIPIVQLLNESDMDIWKR